MNRIAQFLRSLVPADPWQLLFLGGAVFLFISPHLSWVPQELPLSSGSSFAIGASAVREQFVTHMVLLRYLPILGSLVAYFTCFWPGRRPVRRVLLGVFLPTLVGLVLITIEYFRLSTSPRSVFESRPAFTLACQWFFSNVGRFSTGFYFCLFALFMIAAFTLRLSASSLPITLPALDGPPDQERESWKRMRMLIFFLVCPLFLFRGFFEFVLNSPYFGWSRLANSAFATVYVVFLAVVHAALLFFASLLILGKSSTKTARASLRLPNSRGVFFGLILPVVIGILISSASYAMDRVQWAAYEFGRLGPPRFSSYVNAQKIWSFSLLLMVFAAFAEEIVFRGLLLRELMGRLGFYRGIFMTGLIWAAFHFDSDRYGGGSIGGVFLQVASRILICLAMNFVLAWMTLRWNSVIPAGIAHTVSNILVVSGFSSAPARAHDLRIALWALAALFLFRHWPFSAEESPVEAAASVENPSA